MDKKAVAIFLAVNAVSDKYLHPDDVSAFYNDFQRMVERLASGERIGGGEHHIKMSLEEDNIIYRSAAKSIQKVWDMGVAEGVARRNEGKGYDE